MDQNSVNSSNHYLICSETVLTNSTSLSIKKSRWNLNHGLWNWWLFTRSFKMEVAPKPNEILRLASGGDNLHRVSRLLISGGAELLTTDVHQLLFQQYVWGSAGEFTKKFTVEEKNSRNWPKDDNFMPYNPCRYVIVFCSAFPWYVANPFTSTEGINELPVIGSLCYAQRALGSPQGKHCKFLQRNVRRNVVSALKKRLGGGESSAFFAAVLSEKD